MVILVTSQKPLGELSGAAEPEIQILQQLKIEHSVDLFIERAGDMTVHDIYQLILEDKNFQPDLLDGSLPTSIPDPVPQEFKKQML